MITMRAIDLLIKSGRAISQAQARRLILQGALIINDKVIAIQEGENINELNVDLNENDKIRLGNKEIKIYLPAKTEENPQIIEKPQSYYGELSEKWVCLFPGKMGISWKLALNPGTKEEADSYAANHRNVVAVPLALWLRYREYEQRTVATERKLQEELGLRVDYIDEQPVFVNVRNPKP